MVSYCKDTTGRFVERPHYEPKELDSECEHIITDFLRDLHGNIRYPIATEDLKKLIERDADDLDLYADLSNFGEDVEGVTKFFPGEKPRVLISKLLSDDPHRENRLRTTLTHEFGHVHFHSYLWDGKANEQNLFESVKTGEPVTCKRENILSAKKIDWMEWQAGYVCGSLLMPLSQLKRRVSDYRKQNNIFSLVTPESPHGQNLISDTVKAFQVSEEAARVRLLQQKLLVQYDPGTSLFG